MAEKVKKGITLSRRSFLKFAGGLSVTGAVLGLAGCGKPLTPEKAAGGDGWLPTQYDNRGDFPTQVKGRISIDPKNPSITRDDQKCILCGQCIEVCQNVQTVYGYYKLPIKNETICVNCGQCTHWCPTAAITEVDDTQKVWEALADPDKIVIAQTAPAIRVAIGDDYGFPIGTNVEGKMVAALREIGFDYVADTNWAADLTIMEEASEHVHRLKDPTAPYTMFTTCCPAWVKFMEYYYPEMIPKYSTSKSPQAMMGAMIKTYFAEKKGIDPSKIVSVAVMPCAAKKYECTREELNSAAKYHNKPGMRDIDVVLTTREFSEMLKMKKIDLAKLQDSDFDNLVGEASGAGYIFANSGGVIEAAVRTAYFLATGEQPPAVVLDLQPVHGLQGIKEATLEIPGIGEEKIAVAQGLNNARKICDMINAGQAPWRLVEVMACPGGCISGGGQPRSSVPPQDRVREKRIEAVYKIDKSMRIRLSHENPEIKKIYTEFLGQPLSEEAELLLHTHYVPKDHLLTAKKPSEY
ncbi:hydrogenase, Fe-only [Syntrophobotulus glycolicus DSM 8271]|uniref:Hydrogenase, Fe-only n=1 Tax=Syntrophobotulus glycolicus (strain DSM 8271 / FlGlyR) TaxID=645991 RepID=F0T2S5_SYNGF|nr:[FeFe] hydrogenase, group A [Syntrophobotulus glycolicus]ADY56474.1 hydrogenase, Fe-only [Syntrophobotulus glycolicus DSM 8271]